MFKSTATEPFSEQATVTLNTNFFNTYRAFNILSPILKPHARLVNVSSSAGHLSRITGQDTAAVVLKEKLSSPSLTYQELEGLMQDFVRWDIDWIMSYCTLTLKELNLFCLFSVLLRQEINIPLVGQRRLMLIVYLRLDWALWLVFNSETLTAMYEKIL